MFKPKGKNRDIVPVAMSAAFGVSTDYASELIMKANQIESTENVKFDQLIKTLLENDVRFQVKSPNVTFNVIRRNEENNMCIFQTRTGFFAYDGEFFSHINENKTRMKIIEKFSFEHPRSIILKAIIIKKHLITERKQTKILTGNPISIAQLFDAYASEELKLEFEYHRGLVEERVDEYFGNGIFNKLISERQVMYHYVESQLKKSVKKIKKEDIENCFYWLIINEIKSKRKILDESSKFSLRTILMLSGKYKLRQKLDKI